LSTLDEPAFIQQRFEHKATDSVRGQTGSSQTVTMRYAVALYMSSVLGSGVLVLPGLAAQIAGPASLFAWVLLSLASYPLAYTFASLSARKPESGGVYSFARESFGSSTADAVGWRRSSCHRHSGFVSLIRDTT